MKIDKEEILKIAAISKIALQEKEIDSLIQQIEDVLSYAECIKKVASEVVDQPSNRNVNFFREDVVVNADSETVLDRAPEREGNYFVVPKILDTK